MIIKKIGTSQLGGSGDEEYKRASSKRDDETTSLEALRNSLGAGSTLGRGQMLEGRYEVEQVIGYGGMSTVYRVRDTRFTQTVRICALKEMFDISTDPAVRRDKAKRFEEEANFLALLNHISIPKIYDFFSANDRHYLVMELIEGKNLEAVLEENNGPFDERSVLEWGVHLCDVLGYLHRHRPKPIVFRDMKPSNVMITGEGRLVLIDFGIAKTFQEEKKGTMIGTEGYSPPEQYKGLAKPEGDIYALGATMHQLLTNSDPRVEVPFTFHERLPRTMNSKVSAETEAVIMKALEFEIANRWQNVEELKNAMLNILGRGGSGTAAVAPRVGTSSKLIKGIGDNTRDLTQVANTNVLGNIGTGAIGNGRTPGSNPTIPGVSNPDPNTAASILAQRQRNAVAGVNEPITLAPSTPLGKLVWQFASEEEVRSSPVVQNGMIFVGSYDSNLYALDARTGGFIWKAPTNEGICTTPCVTEKMVIVGSEDYTLYAFELTKGQQIWKMQTGGAIRSSVRYYSPMLFFGSDDQQIYCVEARSGRMIWKQRTLGPVRSTPAVVGGIVYVGSEDGHLYALDGNNGNTRWKFRTMEGIVSSPLVQDNRVLIGSRDGHLYCIDTGSNWVLWKYKTNGQVNSSPAIANGKVYFGSVDGHMYCVDSKNGKLVWKFDTGSQVTSSPRVVNGVVYFGGVDQNIYALDAEKGQARWVYATEGPISSSPAVENNLVYIGSLDYRVYAISINV
jgi:eukaryotic-like serine/threonine-protein kinase